VLLLPIGTSNYGSVTDGRSARPGERWYAVAQQASGRGYSDVAIQGAIDAEPGFGPFPHFQGWEWGDKSGRG
jgi:hypothetical protein